MAHLKSKHVGDPYDLYSVLRHNQGLKHQYNWDICLHRDCSSPQ
ncbi:MAG: hypothetical protein NZO16_05990 [Deltaproteobacteria bacterium]|nr:hypothetical protein [Deltaproteobacteria bacterium]